MQEKIISVLNHATQNDGFKYIDGYREIPGHYQFELKTAYSEYGHQTLLRYEATSDIEFVRIEIKHRFGYLDLTGDGNEVANQLMGLLRRNIGAYNGTTAFLGVEFDEGNFYATLGSYHHFLTSWDDGDIASALTLHIFDIIMGLAATDSSLTFLKHFGDTELMESGGQKPKFTKPRDYSAPDHMSLPSLPSFSETKLPVPTNNGLSILAAIATFILGILFIGAMGGRGVFGYICLPTILAVVAYFVTPTVIQLANKENGRKFLHIREDVLTFFKSHFDRKDILENKLDLSSESDKDQEK